VGRIVRRGDNIPPVSDYAHYNEEAEQVWYAENRYDMEHADEIVEEDWGPDDYEEPEEDEDEAIDPFTSPVAGERWM
jgi:hypothetical protein